MSSPAVAFKFPTSTMSRLSSAACLCLLFVGGCRQSSQGWSAAGEAIALRGSVRAGQKPIAGSSIQLYAAGSSGVASSATPLLAEAVTSDSLGNFSLTASNACPSSTSEVYLVARGGSSASTAGVNNPAIGLMTFLGSCADLSSTSAITVNEVTTIGSVWPLASFMSSPVKVGSSGGDAAFQSAASDVLTMVDIVNGTSPGTPTADTSFAESGKLLMLADVLAACTQSSGGVAGDRTPCGSLFSLATTADGGVPSDTLTAAMRIAQHPQAQVSGIYSLARATNSTARLVLSAPPADWSLQLTHSLAAPTITPATGTYIGSQSVTIAPGEVGETIHYTTNGTIPTVLSPVYTGSLQVEGTSIIQAMAVRGLLQSRVATSVLTITPAAAAATKLVFLTQPSNVSTSAAIAPIQVAIEDSTGHIVTSANNVVTLSLSGGAGLLGTVSAVARNGIATFSNLSATIAGAGYTLVAQSSSLGTAVSSSFIVSTPINLPASAAQRADALVDSVGLNVHFSYYGSVYTTQSSQLVSYIQQLNIRHLRDQMAWEGSTVSGSSFYSLHRQLAADGVKTDYILTSPSYPMSQVAAYPNLVNDMEAVEAANEYDASGDPSWVATIRAQQTSLFNQIHGTAATQGITVISPSLAQPQTGTQLGNVSAISDVGDSHAYFAGWNPGNTGINGQNNPAYFMRWAQVNTLTEPVWITETGYWSNAGSYFGGNGVSEALMATYMPRSILEFWLAGAQRTYIYELADYSNQIYFGLLRYDGTPKPAFYAVSNLLTLLKDPGAAFTPGSLAYSVTGGTAQLNRLLLQKRDGSYYLLLWVESPGQNGDTSALLSVPSQNVQVNLGRFPLLVVKHQLDETGTMTNTIQLPSQSIPVSVGPNVTVLEIH